jgi:hypothetical protein
MDRAGPSLNPEQGDSKPKCQPDKGLCHGTTIRVRSISRTEVGFAVPSSPERGRKDRSRWRRLFGEDDRKRVWRALLAPFRGGSRDSGAWEERGSGAG